VLTKQYSERRNTSFDVEFVLLQRKNYLVMAVFI
jgi:hypothetical protein